MLQYSAVILWLLCPSLCLSYKDEVWMHHGAFGKGQFLHHKSKLWEPVETIGVSGGCCIPDKMEAELSVILGRVENSKPVLTIGQLNLSFDAKQGMAFLAGDVLINGTHEVIKSWYDYSKGMMYIMYRGKPAEHCYKLKLSLDPLSSKCIPEGTTKIREAYYGSKNGSNGSRLDVTWYRFVGNKENTDFDAYISFADTEVKNQCVPVTVGQYGGYNGVPYTLDLDFTNIVPMVKDESVFKIPTICKGVGIHGLPVEYAALEFLWFR